MGTAGLAHLRFDGRLRLAVLKLCKPSPRAIHFFLSTMFRLLSVVLVALTVQATVVADEPGLKCIGPPSWWSAERPQQISLLIEGSGLVAPRVSVDRESLRIDRVESGIDGRAIFVDITIAAG